MKFQVVCPNCTVDCSMNRKVDLFPTTNRDSCSKCMGMIACRVSYVLRLRDCYMNMRTFTHNNHRTDILRSFLRHYKCIVCEKLMCQACWIEVWKIIGKTLYPGPIPIVETPTTDHGAFKTPTTEHGAFGTPTTDYGAVTPATSDGYFGTPAINGGASQLKYGGACQVPIEVTALRTPGLTCTGCKKFNLALNCSFSDTCSHCREGRMGTMFKCSGSTSRRCSFAICIKCWIDAFHADNKSGRAVKVSVCSLQQNLACCRRSVPLTFSAIWRAQHSPSVCSIISSSTLTNFGENKT